MKELLTGIINKIQQIAEKLGLIADYVVEQGTSGIWTYRKWNSGIAECWGSKYLGEIALTTSTASGALYTNSAYQNASITLPTDLFNDMPTTTHANIQSNGYTLTQAHSVNPTTVAYRIWSPYSATITGAIISFDVKGRWK